MIKIYTFSCAYWTPEGGTRHVPRAFVTFHVELGTQTEVVAPVQRSSSALPFRRPSSGSGHST